MSHNALLFRDSKGEGNRFMSDLSNLGQGFPRFGRILDFNIGFVLFFFFVFFRVVNDLWVSCGNRDQNGCQECVEITGV